MYFRIIRNNETLAVGNDALSFDGDFEINSTGSFTVKFPIKYIRYLLYKNGIEIYLDDGRIFQGESISKSIDKKAETIDVSYESELTEWNWESVPINVVKKDASVSQLMKDSDMVYQRNKWEIDVIDDANIEYEFSRETKREALDKIVELTPDLNYRVSLTEKRKLEIGKFGEHKQFLVTFNNILDNLVIEDDTSSIINYAVSLSDKSDGGATSITLRDIYENPDLQIEGFPVIITGNSINTQASQVGYNYTEYAPNNINEYAVLDEESIKREDGDIYEGTFSANDIQPVQEDGEAISNDDRIKAAQTLYNQAVRKLLYSRRNLRFTVPVDDFPTEINVGDKIRVLYSNNEDVLTDCFGLYSANLLMEDSWLYIVQINFSALLDGTLRYRLTLSRDLAQYFQIREN